MRIRHHKIALIVCDEHGLRQARTRHGRVEVGRQGSDPGGEFLAKALESCFVSRGETRRAAQQELDVGCRREADDALDAQQRARHAVAVREQPQSRQTAKTMTDERAYAADSFCHRANRGGIVEQRRHRAFRPPMRRRVVGRHAPTRRTQRRDEGIPPPGLPLPTMDQQHRRALLVWPRPDVGLQRDLGVVTVSRPLQHLTMTHHHGLGSRQDLGGLRRRFAARRRAEEIPGRRCARLRRGGFVGCHEVVSMMSRDRQSLSQAATTMVEFLDLGSVFGVMPIIGIDHEILE